MKIPHEKFCVLPWISLEASPIGSIRPCCLAEEEIVNDAGEKFDLNSANLAQVQTSAYMRQLRQDFLDAKQPRTCRKCWNEERSGRVSKRMHTLDRLKHIIADDQWTTDAKPLQFLDLKLGNICNLKCRICGSWSSSTFAVEELQYVANDQKKNSFHYSMLQKGAWPRENIYFWQQIDGIVDHIQYIEFTGGEPFMIREHFDLLRSLISRGIASKIEIHYNTNGTQWPEEAADIWQHFKTVEIAFSIDDIGDRFEYQRTNAVWSDVMLNLQKFRDLRNRLPNIQLQVCSTVNVFNVMYIEDLANWIDAQEFDFVYWNMLHEAYYFSIGTLPDRAKNIIIKRLENAEVNDFHKSEFHRMIDFMQKGASLDGKILRMKIADFDWRRTTDLRHHHRELAEAIDYEGPRV
jgi:MoaA/NifB/PqqE/SkfB family radical SAM enzyme